MTKDYIQKVLDNLEQCDDMHDRCDYLIEHSDITYLLEYINTIENALQEINKLVNAQHIASIEARLMIKDILNNIYPEKIKFRY